MLSFDKLVASFAFYMFSMTGGILGYNGEFFVYVNYKRYYFLYLIINKLNIFILF